MLSWTWIPTAENEVADGISRQSRDAIIRIAPASFQAVWDEMDPFDVDLMACTVSVLRSPLNLEALPFFSQYGCAGAAGTDVFTHDISLVPGTSVPAFRLVSHPRSWQATSCKIWRKARPARLPFGRMLRPMGSLWYS